MPAGIAYGAQNKATLTATFSYSGASPALANAVLTVTDVTTAGEASALVLKKMVSNVTRGGASSTSVNAEPRRSPAVHADRAEHRRRGADHAGDQRCDACLHHLRLGGLPGTLGSGITSCSVSTQPGVGAAGNLQWTFTGSLAPGGQMAVTYQVKLSQ